MFIKALKNQNPALIDAAYQLWQQGSILPDTYVIDVEQVLINAQRLLNVAANHGIELYLMTKQLGRNPWLAKRLIELGYRGTVAVDFKEARTLINARVPVSHVGHLVQLPTRMVNFMVQERPEVITVFSLKKAQEISHAAQQTGHVQSIMLKIYDEQDYLYPGQESGFPLAQLSSVAEQIAQLPGIKLTGLTHFPCLLWQDDMQEVRPTPNLFTLLKAKELLQQAGVDVTQLNAPSASSCNSLPLLAKYGITHAEPGHALTGTIPANQKGDQPERIGMLYLTEISHQFKGNSYCYGGGYYRRGHAANALVFSHGDADPVLASLLPIDDSSIDYHLPLAGELPVGSAVVMCFRTQIFVTRSDVALVSGISSGKPVLEGLFDSQGQPLSSAGGLHYE